MLSHDELIRYSRHLILPEIGLGHHGTRSRQAVELLRAAGFAKVRNVRGGIDAWAAEVNPRLTRY